MLAGFDVAELFEDLAILRVLLRNLAQLFERASGIAALRQQSGQRHPSRDVLRFGSQHLPVFRNRTRVVAAVG